MIYTSGSTGRPKGVVVSHVGIPSLSGAQVERFGLNSDSRVLQFASLSFDAASMEIFMTFAAGAALVVPSAGVLLGEDLAAALNHYAVSHALIPPSALSGTDARQVQALSLIHI